MKKRSLLLAAAMLFGGSLAAVHAADGGAGKTESSTTTTYDSLDTNQDGTVSEMERMVGELQEAVASLASSSDASGNTTTNQQIAELAQKIYAQVAEGLTDSTRTLSTSA